MEVYDPNKVTQAFMSAEGMSGLESLWDLFTLVYYECLTNKGEPQHKPSQLAIHLRKSRSPQIPKPVPSLTNVVQPITQQGSSLMSSVCRAWRLVSLQRIEVLCLVMSIDTAVGKNRAAVGRSLWF